MLTLSLIPELSEVSYKRDRTKNMKIQENSSQILLATWLFDPTPNSLWAGEMSVS